MNNHTDPEPDFKTGSETHAHVDTSDPTGRPELTIVRFVALHRTITWADSEVLVGPGLTARIRESCAYCPARDERGVAEWDARTWLGLLVDVLATGGEVSS